MDEWNDRNIHSAFNSVVAEGAEKEGFDKDLNCRKDHTGRALSFFFCEGCEGVCKGVTNVERCG